MIGKKILAFGLTAFMTIGLTVFGMDSTTGPAIKAQKEIENQISVDRINEVKVGQNFSIVLSENPSTGFSWSWKTDETALKFVQEYTLDVNKGKNLVGAPVDAVFVFKGIQKGEYKITMTYSRSWEKDVAPLKTVEYTVIVDLPAKAKAPVVKIENPIKAGQAALVKVGQTFSVVLEQNASTGYSWTYKMNTKALQLVSQATQTINPDPNIVGAPTNKVFTFKALKKGTQKIMFAYARSWERNAKPLKTVTYTIKVK